MKSTDVIDQASMRDDVPDFAAGDTLKVHVKVIEGNKERLQMFQGVVISRRGSGLQESFTVRVLAPEAAVPLVYGKGKKETGAGRARGRVMRCGPQRRPTSSSPSEEVP